MQVSAKHPGAANLMAHLCKELDIARFINHMVTWDDRQWKVSPGTLITALVINILVHRRPLYRVERFYEAMDMPLLFEEDIQAQDLNDDALGRALDRLAEIDCRQLLGTIACRAANIEDMEIRSVHADTTSFSVYGSYENEDSNGSFEKQFIEIVYGHSKDKRDDLKQLKFGLMVTNDGFPIVGTVNSGNESDMVWSRDILDEFKVSFLETWNVAFVADSALITMENLKAMDAKKIRFISVLPGRYSLAQELRDRAWEEGRWRYRGPMSKAKDAAHYWTQTLQAEFAGRVYRFIVVRSSKLDNRKEKKLERVLETEQKDLAKLKKQLEKESFQCEPDAKARLDAVLAENKTLHRLTGRVVRQQKIKRPPGRPRKDRQEAVLETITTFRLEIDIHPPTEEALTEWRQREATFVLITSVSEDLYDDYDVLKEYKGQINVEMRFRFLKDPMFVNAIYLKTPKRVQALGYVILLAVMIASLLEMRIREAMAKEKATISTGPRTLDRPTARVLLDMLNTIQVVYLTYDDHVERHLPYDIPPDVLRLLKFAGYDERIYLENPFRKPT